MDAVFILDRSLTSFVAGGHECSILCETVPSLGQTSCLSCTAAVTKSSFLFETLQPGFREILLGAAKENEGMQSSLGTEINV